jgi:hypothetical protein
LLVKLTLFSAFGCNADDKKSNTPSSSVADAFLKFADFDSTKSASIDKTELASQINQDSEYIANEPDDTDSTIDAEGNCFYEKWADFVITATQDSLTLGSQIDYGSCLTEFYSSPENKKIVTLKEAEWIDKTYIKFVNPNCKADELSKYNGKKFSELPYDVTFKCDGALPATIIMNSETTQKTISR